MLAHLSDDFHTHPEGIGVTILAIAILILCLSGRKAV